MNQRTPGDPPPAAGTKELTSAFAPGIYVGTRDPVGGQINEPPAAEPRKSFFRGVAVGIAIMIPIWTWVVIRFLH